MSGKLLKSFFSSGLQAISVQVLGVFFLGIVAYYLSEDDFGIISWCNAVAMFATTVLGFGLEQVVTRRIAASRTSEWAAAAFFFHAFITSIAGIILVVFFNMLLGDRDVAFQYLPFFFVAQSLLLIIVPLKQFLNAKHLFAPYGVIAIVSNVLKITIAFYLQSKNELTVMSVSVILISAAIIELIALLVYVTKYTSFRFQFRRQAYVKLIKEALPQYFSAIFDTTLSRLDWILLGLIVTYAATGGYSFAYRAYELARLPIVIIAPVILNIFANHLVKDGTLSDDKKATVKKIFAVEMYVAVLIPLVLCILWSPMLDSVEKFNGKYGSKNEIEFILLSVCIPLHFLINLLWTIAFSARRYKVITLITVITALSNLVLNLSLIPFYGGIGAAVAYLITSLIQASLYYFLAARPIIKVPVQILLLYMAIAAGLFWLLYNTNMHVLLKVLTGTIGYILIVLLTGTVKRENFRTLLAFVKK